VEDTQDDNQDAKEVENLLVAPCPVENLVVELCLVEKAEICDPCLAEKAEICDPCPVEKAEICDPCPVAIPLILYHLLPIIPKVRQLPLANIIPKVLDTADARVDVVRKAETVLSLRQQYLLVS
jgi:hypothetical protein